jgi:hypothetical protein
MATTQDAAANTITEFRNAVASRKIQQPNRYRVILQDSKLNSLKCYPETVTLPQRSFNTAPYTPWGPMLQLPVRREYGECAMSFIIYEDWAERRFLERWMDTIIPPQASENPQEVGVNAAERFLGPSIGGIFDIFNGGLSRSVSTSQYGDYSNPFNNSVGRIEIWTGPSDKNTNDVYSSKITLIDAYPLTLTPTALASEATGYASFVAIFAFREYIFN